MLACMADVDGPVTEPELRVFMDVLEKEFSLTAQEISRARAILFKFHGHRKSFDEYAQEFYRYFKRSPATLENAVDVLLAMAYEDNHITLGEKDLITRVAQIFHVGGGDLERLMNRYHKHTTSMEEPKAEKAKTKRFDQQQAHEDFTRDGSSEQNKRTDRSSRSQEQSKWDRVFVQNSVPWADILQVSPQASPSEVKRQYRNLVKRYHPDSQPKGIPEEMKRSSTKRFVEIQKAYDFYCGLHNPAK